MYHVYILENLDGRHYIGYTSKSPQERVYEHNTSKGRWTRYKGPWTLVYSEEFITKEEAFKREQQIKRYKGGEAFKKLIR
jgi:putative endonuclease